MQKTSSHHSIWAVLRATDDKHLLTLGCLYLDSAVPVDEYELQVREVLAARTGRTVALGDVNTHMNWLPGDDGLAWPSARGSKLLHLLDLCMAEDLHIVPQSDHTISTFTHRKATARSSQIDVASASLAQCGETQVHVGTRKAVGTDHDLISLSFKLPQASVDPKNRLRKPGPLRVTHKPEMPANLDRDAGKP